jgi:DNA-binding transcriptional ArsR family regulator
MTNHAAVLTALADPTRRGIFEQLADHPQTVGELARDLPVSRPAVSQHLKVLKTAGLVQDRPVGTRRVYVVSPGGLESVRSYFDRFWRQSLAAFAAAANHANKEGQ